MRFPLVPQLYCGTHLSRQLHCRHSEDMRSRYRINEPDAAHFITSTIVEWLPVFTTEEAEGTRGGRWVGEQPPAAMCLSAHSSIAARTRGCASTRLARQPTS